MNVGEKCLLISDSKYAYGDKGSPPTIPAKATLNFEIELLDVHEKGKYEMTPEERIICGGNLKEKGNKAFKLGNLEQARKFYKKAIDTTVDEDEFNVKDLHISLNSNMMAVLLKLKDYIKVVAYGKKLIQLDPSNIKGWYRRGLANLELNNLEDAKNDLLKAHELDKTNGEIYKELKKVYEKIKEA